MGAAVCAVQEQGGAVPRTRALFALGALLLGCATAPAVCADAEPAAAPGGDAGAATRCEALSSVGVADTVIDGAAIVAAGQGVHAAGMRLPCARPLSGPRRQRGRGEFSLRRRWEVAAGGRHGSVSARVAATVT